jgi:hypothetical protein
LSLGPRQRSGKVAFGPTQDERRQQPRVVAGELLRDGEVHRREHIRFCDAQALLHEFTSIDAFAF